jgi:hypothetical protein
MARAINATPEILGGVYKRFIKEVTKGHLNGCWTLAEIVRLIRRAYYMPIIDIIGKTLYPRRQLWERRRKVKTLIVVVLISLVAFAFCTLIIILED